MLRTETVLETTGGSRAPQETDEYHGSAFSAASGVESKADDEAIEGFRSYLLRVAERALRPALKTKEGASDVVQETLVDAHRKFRRFEGRSRGGTALLASKAADEPGGAALRGGMAGPGSDGWGGKCRSTQAWPVKTSMKPWRPIIRRPAAGRREVKKSRP